MKLNLLNKEELTNLYKDEMMFDFPRAELKPLRAMLRLMDMGQYDPLLVTDDQGVALGYAMIWLPRARNGALLEYLGVLRGKRNGGLGSQVLPLLAARYGQLFGEAEAPTSDDPAENDLRRRRIAFYERNGFRVLDYECALFGVHYRALIRGAEDVTAEELLQVHQSIYRRHFPPALYQRFIQIPLRPGERPNPPGRWMEEEKDGVSQ